MFADADLTRDAFLGGRIELLQPRRGYRAATDPVLLAAAVPARAGQSVLDLGCGAGTAALCLAARVPGLVLAGLELQPAYAELARRNAALNRVAFDVFEGDAAHPPAALRARTFDHVILNPPYFPPGAGSSAADPGREAALREALPLPDWIATGLRRLRDGGRLTLIQAADRLPDLIAAVRGRGAIALLPVQPRHTRPAGRVILSVTKGGRGPFRLCAPLVVHEGDAHAGDRDDTTPQARAILRDAAAIDL